MANAHSDAPSSSPTFLVFALVLLLGSFGVMVTTANDIDLTSVAATADLTPEETAYYEYVAPRLDRLVREVDDVVVMVEGKSRDIIALTISGSRIEELTQQINSYGEDNGIPARFRDAHSLMVEATRTTTSTFGQAREALRTFNFSHMSDLVTEFQAAAEMLHEAQGEVQSIVGGTVDAVGSRRTSEPAASGLLVLSQSGQDETR